MAVGWVGFGVQSLGTGSRTATYPTGLEAGDVAVLLYASKLSTSTQPDLSGSGWTQLDSQVVGTGSDGEGTGQIRLTAYTRECDGTEDGTTFSVNTSPTANVAAVTVFGFRPSSGYALAFSTAYGSDTSSDTSFSVTASGNLGETAGDQMVALVAVTENTTLTGTSWDPPGATYGGDTREVYTSGAGGNNLRFTVERADSITGTASGATVFSGTLGAASTGGALFVRVHEVLAVTDKSDSDSGAGVDAVTAVAVAVTDADTASGVDVVSAAAQVIASSSFPGTAGADLTDANSVFNGGVGGTGTMQFDSTVYKGNDAGSASSAKFVAISEYVNGRVEFTARPRVGVRVYGRIAGTPGVGAAFNLLSVAGDGNSTLICGVRVNTDLSFVLRNGSQTGTTSPVATQADTWFRLWWVVDQTLGIHTCKIYVGPSREAVVTAPDDNVTVDVRTQAITATSVWPDTLRVGPTSSTTVTGWIEDLEVISDPDVEPGPTSTLTLLDAADTAASSDAATAATRAGVVDTAAAVDAVASSTRTTGGDSADVVDDVTATARTVPDTAAAVDAYTDRDLGAADTAAAAEAPATTRGPLPDTASAVDAAVVVGFVVPDTATAVDVVAVAGRVAADTAAGADAVAGASQSRTAADTAAGADTAPTVTRGPATDTATGADAVTVVARTVPGEAAAAADDLTAVYLSDADTVAAVDAAPDGVAEARRGRMHATHHYGPSIHSTARPWPTIHPVHRPGGHIHPRDPDRWPTPKRSADTASAVDDVAGLDDGTVGVGADLAAAADAVLELARTVDGDIADVDDEQVAAAMQSGDAATAADDATLEGTSSKTAADSATGAEDVSAAARATTDTAAGADVVESLQTDATRSGVDVAAALEALAELERAGFGEAGTASDGVVELVKMAEDAGTSADALPVVARTVPDAAAAADAVTVSARAAVRDLAAAVEQVFARALRSADVAAAVEAWVDVTPPTTPGQPTATTTGLTVALSWAASTDNVGVTGYEVHRSVTSGFTPAPATLRTTVAGTSWTDTTVTAGTWYYRVVARDAAGNASAASTQRQVTVTASAGLFLGHVPGRVYLGWSTDQGDEAMTTQIDTLTPNAGSYSPLLGVRRFYNKVQSIINYADAQRRVVWVSVKGDELGTTANPAGWASVASGARDANIVNWLTSLVARDKLTIFSFHHEPIGDQTATSDGAVFAAANRRIRQVLDAEFAPHKMLFVPNYEENRLRNLNKNGPIDHSLWLPDDWNEIWDFVSWDFYQYGANTSTNPRAGVEMSHRWWRIDELFTGDFLPSTSSPMPWMNYTPGVDVVFGIGETSARPGAFYNWENGTGATSERSNMTGAKWARDQWDYIFDPANINKFAFVSTYNSIGADPIYNEERLYPAATSSHSGFITQTGDTERTIDIYREKVLSGKLVKLGADGLPDVPQETPPVVLLVSSDVQCQTTAGTRFARSVATSDLALTLTFDHVISAGDAVYDGLLSTITGAYGWPQHWGRGQLLSKLQIVPGNHDYNASREGFDGYFSTAQRGATGTYYRSGQFGAWRGIFLNVTSDRDVPCSVGTTQYNWLAAELAAHPDAPTFVVMHEPRYTIGDYSDSTGDPVDVWALLLQHPQVEFVISGHAHSYQRYARMNNAAQVDTVGGIRQIICAMGGGALDTPPSARTGLEARNTATSQRGVLLLTLEADRYAWEFRQTSDSTPALTDTGSQTVRVPAQ